jgi:restriction system protein
MAIPDYQSIMLPLLKLVADGNEHSVRETIEGLADEFRLLDDDNRVAWARTYMNKAGLLDATRRGCLSSSSELIELIKTYI